MSRLTELITQVGKSDAALAEDLRREVGVLGDRLPFGLNFERHVPESVQLPTRRVRLGDKVVIRAADGADREPWIVVSFDGSGPKRKAQIVRPAQPDGLNDAATVPVNDLVVIAEFRDPIYPGLRSTSVIERSADKPFHAVISGENYHVLQALSFVCRGQVDCIYIDPPYNTRDKDWKYNNDYVDADDRYRHSKWLAMMERRLALAKVLLRPDDSALIVTIDEKEHLRLGLLLEQTFPDARIQMVTSVISAKGAVRRGQFSRVEEHIFFVLFGDAEVEPWIENMLNRGDETLPELNADVFDEGAPSDETRSPHHDRGNDGEPVEWLGLRRREPSSIRGSRKNQFFPIFVEAETGCIHSVGNAVADDVDRNTVEAPSGTVALWPLKPSGAEMIWGLTPEAVRKNLAGGYVRTSRWAATKAKGTVQYLPSGTIDKIRKGEITVLGRRADGSVEAIIPSELDQTTPPKRVWHMPSHNAETGGTKVLSALIPGRRFDYPKSVYAVEDALRFVVGKKPSALVLDFFAGSGTTAHAVMRLNKQDGGCRRSIMVTNNEVSASEANTLAKAGFRPGDSEWESLGVSEYITKPRLLAAISGHTPDDQKAAGRYRYIDEFPMADGFEENAEFFDLTYEDPDLVQYGLDFDAIAPLLWLRAGSTGARINSAEETLALADAYAILFDLDAAGAFVAAVRGDKKILTAFIITDDETQFQVVAGQLPRRARPVRLYAAYLDNFRIQAGA